MPRPQTFERDLRVATAGLEPEAIKALLAKTARAALAEAQAARQFPSSYVRSVNGRVGATEESVQPPGPIVYTANWWSEVLKYGIGFAEDRSPVKSGRFKRSWFVLANGSLATDYEALPLGAETIITNDQPYARKIEVGHMKMSVPPGIVEDLVLALRRKFGDLLNIRRTFISLEGAHRLQNSSKGRRRHAATRSGRPLTYPAAVISMRF